MSESESEPKREPQPQRKKGAHTTANKSFGGLDYGRPSPLDVGEPVVDAQASEFEPDHESTSRASELTSRLMEDLEIVVREGPSPEVVAEVFSAERYVEQAEGVPLADVVESVGQMATEFAFVRQFESSVPCLQLDDGGLAPVSISKLLGGLPPHYPTNAFLRLMASESSIPLGRNFIQELLRGHQQKDPLLKVVDVGEAVEATRRNLAAFLGFRFVGMELWDLLTQHPESLLAEGPDPLPSEIGPGGGLQVQVYCTTPGLRIHISKAFFIDWVFFGSPSTPVASYVLPGRYIFAGDGPMLPKRVTDETVFAIPPTYQPSLTRF